MCRWLLCCSMTFVFVFVCVYLRIPQSFTASNPENKGFDYTPGMHTTGIDRMFVRLLTLLFRLHNGAEYLFVAGDSAELLQWVSKISALAGVCTCTLLSVSSFPSLPNPCVSQQLGDAPKSSQLGLVCDGLWLLVPCAVCFLVVYLLRVLSWRARDACFESCMQISF